MENSALACRSCNVFKSDAIEAIDPSTGNIVPIFNPRADVWTTHFAVDDDNRIVGQTATGRATIIRLNINAERQVAARRRWRQLKLFP